MIPAYSPQARGRMERNYGSWQGRLPQELRLRGIPDLERASRIVLGAGRLSQHRERKRRGSSEHDVATAEVFGHGGTSCKR